MPTGRQFPKIIAARPMYPRPPVCPTWKPELDTMESIAPPRPAHAPEISTATNL